MHVIIIAEAGVNHNGQAEMALELVDVAAASGADIVKFQAFRADAVVTRTAPKAAYQKTAGGGDSQFEMLRALELAPDDYRVIARRCAERGIEFLATAFDAESLDLLLGLGLKRIKIPSGEITNAPLLLKAARAGLPIVMSTGLATIDEIETALGVLAFGMCDTNTAPCQAGFGAAFASREGKARLAERITLLHCTSQYPADIADVNLRAMDTMATAFGLPVGYSDHTAGIAVGVAAAARGAVMIEKHFTLDKSLPGPDHKASLAPPELASLIAGVRAVETALGSPLKLPSPGELPNLPIVRRSLVTRRAMRRGEVFAEADLDVLRPGTGVSPMRFWDVLGRTAARDLAAGAVIEPADIGA